MPQKIHDWAFLAIKPADLKSKAGGPFSRGFIFRLAKGGRLAKGSGELKVRYHEIIASRAM